MQSRWKRVGAIIGLIGALGLTACEAEVDTPEDVNVEEPAGEGEGEGGEGEGE